MKNKTLWLKILISAIVVLFFSSFFLFERQFYKLLNPKVSQVEQYLSESSLQLHFVDVGQGDAIAIRLPDDKKILIDSGTPERALKLEKYLKTKFFKKGEEQTFDIFLITHPHQDHIGGGMAIFESFQVNNFYRPFVYLTTETEDTTDFTFDSYVFSQVVQMSKCEPNCTTVFFDRDTEINGENYSFQFFTPWERIFNVNNFSPLILFKCFNKKFVLTGDLESDAEQKILEMYDEELSNVDLLKVGHHGSKTSSSSEFVTTLKPSYSVISVGRNNEYGHPNQTTLDNLNAIESKIYRTDNNGNIIFGLYKNYLIYVYDYFNRLPIRLQLWYILVPCATFCVVVVFNIKFKTEDSKGKE